MPQDYALQHWDLMQMHMVKDQLPLVAPLKLLVSMQLQLVYKAML